MKTPLRLPPELCFPIIDAAGDYAQYSATATSRRIIDREQHSLCGIRYLDSSKDRLAHEQPASTAGRLVGRCAVETLLTLVLLDDDARHTQEQ